MFSNPQTGILKLAAGCAAIDAIAVARSALLTERYGGQCSDPDYLALSALLLESAMRSGHVSLTLERSSLLQELNGLQQREQRYGTPTPAAEEFFTQAGELLRSTAPQTVFTAAACQGSEGMFSAQRPDAELVASDGCLYHRRYYDYEQQIRQYLSGVRRDTEEDRLLLRADELQRAREVCAALHGKQGPGTGRSALDLQWAAAAMALLRPLTVITGGPGTGKTHTVLDIVLLLRAIYGPDHCIALAAPTGKAAARLRELLAKLLADMDLEPDHGRGGAAARASGFEWSELAAQASETAAQAQTLHRLLGTSPYQVRARSDAANPLQADSLIVDEASMIDVSLFCRLLQALRPGTRLILLGDHHQLGPVEPGAVLMLLSDELNTAALTTQLRAALGPLCGCTAAAVDAAAKKGWITGFSVNLRHNYRASEVPGLVALAGCLQERQGAEALQKIIAGHDELELRPWPHGDEDVAGAAAVRELVGEALGDGGQGYAVLFEHLRRLPVPYTIDDDSDADPLWELLDRYRLLCANRNGPLGASAINTALDAAVISRFGDRSGFMRSRGFYPGRIIMLTRNDPDLNLSNGDVGFMARDGRDGGRLKLFLRTADRIRRLGMVYLEDCEPAYALTVHKAQGSEYQQVSVVLPLRYNCVLSAELLYTAVTRARKHVIIHGSAELISQILRSTPED